MELQKKLRNLEMEAEIVEEISTLLEAGLPNLVAVKIYQAGIRSRSSATELSTFFENETWEKSIKDYKQEIVANKGFYAGKVSPLCNEWIELLVNTTPIRKRFVHLVPAFTFGNIHEMTNILLAKKINSQQYLMSPDYKVIEKVEGTKIDFSSINDIPGIYFEYDKNDKSWHLIIDNPYVEVLN